MNIDESLTVLFSDYYQKMKWQKSSYIPDTVVVKAVLVPMYRRFVSEGLTPIENLSHENKMSLVNECRMTGEKYTNESLTDQCRILYLLKTITNDIKTAC